MMRLRKIWLIALLMAELVEQYGFKEFTLLYMVREICPTGFEKYRGKSIVLGKKNRSKITMTPLHRECR